MSDTAAILYGLPLLFVASVGASFLQRRIPLWIAALLGAGAGTGIYFLLSASLKESVIPGQEDSSHTMVIIAAALGGLGLMIGLHWPLRRIFGNFEFDFASRITFRHQRSISSLVVRLGIVSIMLGVAVMEIAASLVAGFQGEIQNKIVGFGGHVHIGYYLSTHDSNILPMSMENEWVDRIDSLPNVESISPFTLKPVMLRGELAQDGLMLKGVDSTYDFSFFQDKLLTGEIPAFNGKKTSYDLLLSERTADLLGAEVGHEIVGYFFELAQERIRVRKFEVKGIFATGMEEFDREWAFVDHRVLQRLWRWEDDEVSGFEVKLKTLDQLDTQVELIEDELDVAYEANPITDTYAELFNWINLQNQQVWIIIAMMTLIAVINMISVILILILERTRTIGLLKTMGLSNLRIVSIFVSNAFFLILIGLALGNLVGLGLIASQDWLGWLQMDQESYFVSEAPVRWVWLDFLWINLGVMLVCTFAMLLPSLIVLRISPVRALRFD